VSAASDEPLLVLRAQADDRVALETLLRGIQPRIHRYAASLVGRQEAADLVQDTLIQICRKLRWLEDPRRFRAWAYRIASRMAFQRLRRERRVVAIPIEDAASERLEAPSVTVEDELLDELLAHDALSPASRAVLLLHFREEMSLAEVAAVLEIPLGTAKSRLAFGLKTLRAHARRP
jgi:RNA polymerase sigma-70 factor (ECF subfamily)